MANVCELCTGHGAFSVVFPEKFRGMLQEFSQEYGDLTPSDDVAIACACNWYAWAEFTPTTVQYAQGYMDVAAVVLGQANDQQWYNVLANSTEHGTGVEILEKWAAQLGLSTDWVL